MSSRELPHFLTQGDRSLGLPLASPQARIRAGGVSGGGD